MKHFLSEGHGTEQQIDAHGDRQRTRGVEVRDDEENKDEKDETRVKCVKREKYRAPQLFYKGWATTNNERGWKEGEAAPTVAKERKKRGREKVKERTRHHKSGAGWQSSKLSGFEGGFAVQRPLPIWT
jgi:hypothetical protein